MDSPNFGARTFACIRQRCYPKVREELRFFRLRDQGRVPADAQPFIGVDQEARMPTKVAAYFWRCWQESTRLAGVCLGFAHWRAGLFQEEIDEVRSATSAAEAAALKLFK